MSTTSNNGWTIPADTDLVRNGALAIRTLGNGIDSTIGAWKTTWTPAVQGTGWAKGNGTTTGRYKQISDVVFFELQFVMGSTTTFGTGGLSFDQPAGLTNDSTMDQWVQGAFFDNSANLYYDITAKISGGNIIPYVQASAGTVTNSLNTLISTRPVTVASTDVVQISGSYRV